jgi:hypothetical protein
VTSLTISDVFPLIDLRSCVSRLSKCRTQRISGYTIESRYVDEDENEDRWTLDELLSDASLCNMLLSVGLTKLVFCISYTIPTVMPIIRLIVERLPQLQIVELDCDHREELPHLLHTLINDLVQLTFLTVRYIGGASNSALILLDTLKTLHTRSFRSEVFDSSHETIVFFWL